VATGADVRTPAARAGAYVALSVGPILAEELAPLGAGAAASQGELALWPAVIVMTLGGWVSTGLLYALGRWRGAWLRRRFPRAEATVEKLLAAVERRPWRSALAVRYAFGLRVLLPLACGAAHVRADVTRWPRSPARRRGQPRSRCWGTGSDRPPSRRCAACRPTTSTS
jgi:membrane protein YqaA with SNARE-associated domain